MVPRFARSRRSGASSAKRRTRSIWETDSLNHRRDIAYLRDVREVPIRDVASELEFITSRGNWGMLARRGHFEIEMADLHRIGIAMGARVKRDLDERGASIAPLRPL